MRPPGLLADLGRAGAAWSRRVAARLEVLLQGAGPNPFLRAAPDEETAGLASADWPGFPSRVAACLGRAQALALLDWSGPSGPRALQEEYVEWRVVRDAEAISRVELTTEFGEYWRVLAAHEPERTLALVARFAERDDVEPESVYGPLDPFAPGVTADEREAAFADAMLDPRAMSPYNDGRAAICCMVQPSNTLDALLGLAIAATTRRIARDDVSGRLRCMTCDEAIPLMDGAAMAGRASDPVLVERFGRLAFEGRLVAVDDPIGVYIAAVEHTRLRTRDGDAVPEEWFTFSRGAEADETGVTRHQRLVLAPPPETGIAVSDLVDAATEQPIRHGGQIAELVKVVALVRVSGPDAVDAEMPAPTEIAEAEGDTRDCAVVRSHHEAFLAAS